MRGSSTCFAALALAAVFAACSPGASEAAETLARTASDDWAAGMIADFRLTERSGRSVTRADLLGRPAVLDFVFTTCSGPCPTMSRHMRELQDALEGRDVRLVSFSVDPATDTPAVLADYAARFGADAERWWFLTGDEAQIGAVVGSLRLPWQRDIAAPLGTQVAHSVRFVVLDERGLVRGFYPGDDEEGVQAALARARWLAEHRGR